MAGPIGLAFVTFSWDDGHPNDLRLGELLLRYGFKATFFVPRTNQEGLRTMSPGDLKELSASFEIGSHTATHRYLRHLNKRQASEEILGGKMYLEQILQRRVTGFCYPGGTYSQRDIELVRDAGFEYARTTAGFCLAPTSLSRFEIATSLQIYPHSRIRLLRNYLRRGNWALRCRPLLSTLIASSTEERILRLLSIVQETALSRRSPAVLHLWGHSWEIAETLGWKALENLFKLLQNQHLVPIENRAIVRLESGEGNIDNRSN